MYLVLCTRPNIANAVGWVAKYCDAYDVSNCTAKTRSLRYLQTTKESRLEFSGEQHERLICYADVSWASDLDTRRSTTDYLFKLNGNLIRWKSQSTVALSSTEAEYMGLSAATQEAIWLNRLLKEFKIYPEETVLIYQDNQGAIALANNPVFHQRTKHIRYPISFCAREMIEDKEIEIWKNER